MVATSFSGASFVDYLSKDPSCVLEQDPLSRLAQDHQLCMFRHEGFWQCMDTQRDCDYLNDIWKKGNAPWKVSPALALS